MVHNGIEYGIMQAYAEGFDILHHANVGKQDRAVDAETTPLRLPSTTRYDLNLADIAEVWRRGSVISSWLLDLTAMALIENPSSSDYSRIRADSGEGRWTIQAAIEEAVPAEVLTAALYTRFRSRQDHTFAEKMLSAMRQKFGGHVEPKHRQRLCKAAASFELRATSEQIRFCSKLVARSPKPVNEETNGSNRCSASTN